MVVKLETVATDSSEESNTKREIDVNAKVDEIILEETAVLMQDSKSLGGQMWISGKYLAAHETRKAAEKLLDMGYGPGDQFTYKVLVFPKR